MIKKEMFLNAEFTGQPIERGAFDGAQKRTTAVHRPPKPWNTVSVVTSPRPSMEKLVDSQNS